MEGSGKADLSNTAYTIEALYESGLPKNHPYWAKVRVFLKRCQGLHAVNDLVNPTKFPAESKKYIISTDGGFSYGPARSKASGNRKGSDGKIRVPSYGTMSYQGLKSLVYAGVSKNDVRVQAAWNWIQNNYTLDKNPGLGVAGRTKSGQQGLFYYYMAMAKCLDAFGKEVIIDIEGKKHFWRRELAEKLISLQHKKGAWFNPADRWQEGDPVLVTAYAMITLRICLKNWDKMLKIEK
jgi:squalene-hopene/tetraprenyl-beta-curcumene cyclase